METPLFPGGASVTSHGHLHGLPAPYLLAAAAAHHHSLNTSPPPPHLPPLPHPPPHLFPPVSYHSAAAASAAALTRLTSNEHISQSVSKSPSVSAIAASLQAASQSNSKYSIASLTATTNVKDEFSSRYHRPQQHPHHPTVSFLAQTTVLCKTNGPIALF